MNTRRGAENGEPGCAASLPTGSEITKPVVASPKDRLEYIAEMVRELKIMSAQANCQVLADLLERAYLETVRQGHIGV
jgi:hypothetical protein